jgi:hypothetical protein
MVENVQKQVIATSQQTNDTDKRPTSLMSAAFVSGFDVPQLVPYLSCLLSHPSPCDTKDICTR